MHSVSSREMRTARRETQSQTTGARCCAAAAVAHVVSIDGQPQVPRSPGRRRSRRGRGVHGRVTREQPAAVPFGVPPAILLVVQAGSRGGSGSSGGRWRGVAPLLLRVRVGAAAAGGDAVRRKSWVRASGRQVHNRPDFSEDVRRI